MQLRSWHYFVAHGYRVEKKQFHGRSAAALQWSPLRKRLPRQVRPPGVVALSRSLEVVSISISTGIRVSLRFYAKRRTCSVSEKRLHSQRRTCRVLGHTQSTEPHTRVKNVSCRQSHCIPTCTSSPPVGFHASGLLQFQWGGAPSVPLRAGARGTYCPHVKGTVRLASMFVSCCFPLRRPQAAPSHPPRRRGAHSLCKRPVVARILFAIGCARSDA